MAHNLNFNKFTGRTSFFTVREKAWHGLGQVLENCPNSEEAIKHAGLDYEVEKAKVFANVGTQGQMVVVPDKYATYRTDTGMPFGVVGTKYTVVQNRDAFKFFDAIVSEGAAIYETAGALHDGQTIFITAKLPDYIRVAQNDLIEQYLFLTSSHDGSASIKAAFTPIRIVCNNTLNAALRNMTKSINIRHTANAVTNLKEAHKIMGIAHKASLELEQIFNDMAKRRITDPELVKFITQSLIPSAETLRKIEAKEAVSSQFLNTVRDCVRYANVNETQQMPSTKGTLFGAYNAITGYFGNVRGYDNAEAKLESVMDGTALKYNQAAFDLASDILYKGYNLN